MAERVTYALQTPVKLGEQGELVTELAFREPRAKDFRNMPLDIKMGDMIDLAGKLCGQTSAVMDLLSAADLFAVLERVGDFMPAGLQTGQKA